MALHYATAPLPLARRYATHRVMISTFRIFISAVAQLLIVLSILEFYLLFIGKSHFNEGRELGILSGVCLLLVGSMLGIGGWYFSYGISKGCYQIWLQSIAIVGAVLGINAIFNFGDLSTKEIVVSIFGTIIAGAWWFWCNRQKNA